MITNYNLRHEIAQIAQLYTHQRFKKRCFDDDSNFFDFIYRFLFMVIFD